MPPEARPTVSAVVPHWNRCDLLPPFFESLRQQLQPFDDVLLVDNGSSDNSAALAESPIKRIALMRIGTCNIADGVKALEAMYPRIAMGGVIVVDDATTQDRNDEIGRAHV